MQAIQYETPPGKAAPRCAISGVLRSLGLPLLTFIILVIPTLLLWEYDRSASLQFVETRMASYRVRLARRIEAQIESRLRPLRRLSDEASDGELDNPEQFVASARSILREEPTLDFIAWLSRDGTWVAVAPKEAKESAEQMLNGAELVPPSGVAAAVPALFDRLDRAPEGMLVTVKSDTNPMDRPALRADRLLLLPISKPASGPSRRITGAIVTSQSAEDLMGSVGTPDAHGPTNVRLEDEQGRLLYASGDESTLQALHPSRLSPDTDLIRVLDQAWQVRVRSAPGDRSLRPPGDLAVLLISGVVVAALGAGVVAQASLHRQRERRTNLAHLAALESHLRAQQELNEQIRQDADAKAVLLRELNHRVKNNLAGIVGLLSANAPELEPHVQHWLDRAISRIETLARAHELFVSGGSTAHLVDLVQMTLAPIGAMKPPGVNIAIEMDDVDEPLDTDQAVTLAMVVHELASNAFIHGVGEHGTLWIRARRSRGWVAIDVEDDGRLSHNRSEPGRLRQAQSSGVGPIWSDATGSVAVAELAESTRTGIGLSLVRGLVGRELHGLFTIGPGASGGTIASVEFPIRGDGTPESLQ